MRCSHCNIENPSASSYCMNCGQALNIDVTKNERRLITKIKQVNRALTKEKNKLTTHATALETQLTTQKSEINRLQNEKTELERVLKDTQKQQEELQEKFKQLQEQKKQPQKHLIPLWIAVILLSALAATFGVKNCNFSNKIQDCEKEINTLENAIKPLQAEHDFTPKTCKAIVDKAYFYDDNFNRTNSYIYYRSEVKIIRIKGHFGYGVYTNGKNSTTLSGWLRMGDIK